MSEETIKKLEERLKCAICLDTYADPKLLQCFHVFCRDCLVRLVVRDQQGQLSLTCPNCCQATPIPANGVTGLQSAFQVNDFLEIMKEHQKSKDAPTSEEGVKGDTAPPTSSKKVSPYCSVHADKELNEHHEKISDQRAVIEADIHRTTQQLHEIIDTRKTELISQLHQKTQEKLKGLAVQED